MAVDAAIRGPLWGTTAAPVPLTAGKSGALRTADAHARFALAADEGRLYSGGLAAVVAIANVTYTIATLGATCTPILGLWNPSTTAINAHLAQVTLQILITALQNTGAGPFFWASSVGNGGLTLGANPFNRKTGVATGSALKDMSNVALTGLTNNLIVRHGAGVGGGNLQNIASLQTAVGWSQGLVPSKEDFDGSLIIPPGGVLALLSGVTAVAQSAGGSLLWEEMPVLS